MSEGLRLIHKKLVNLMDKLAQFALAYKDLPASPLLTSSPLSRPPSASALPCGWKICCLILNRLNSNFRR